MAALHWHCPIAAEVGDIGLSPEDFPEPMVDVWPENWSAIQLYNQHSTQWRVGMNGPVGLDYNVIFHELDRRGLAMTEYDEFMDNIRLIEAAALDHFSKQ